MTIKLIVARHGNTFNKGDVILRAGSRTDLPLTQEGKRQGLILGEALRSRNLIPSSIYTATLQRTIETGIEALKGLGLELNLKFVDFLRELDYGEDDGQPEEEVLLHLAKCEYPELSDKDVLRRHGEEILKSWNDALILPKGWKHLQDRVNSLGTCWRNFCDQLTTSSIDSNHLVITSNGIARFALEILPNDSIKPTSSKLSTGAFSLFVWDGQKWNLELWNERP